MDCNDNSHLPLPEMHGYAFGDYEDDIFQPSHNYPYIAITDYVPQLHDSVVNSYTYGQQDSRGCPTGLPFITWTANDSQRSSPTLSCETSKDRISVTSPSSSDDGDCMPHLIEPCNQDNATTNRDGRYFCDVRDCKNQEGFTREYDLKRHHCKHEKPSWFCGCCIYGRNKRPYEACRKDHMLNHLRKRHGMMTPFPCEETSCHSGGVIIFSSLGCLRQHFSDKHRQYGRPQSGSHESTLANQVSPTRDNSQPISHVFTSSGTGHPVSQSLDSIAYTAEASDKSYSWNRSGAANGEGSNRGLMIPRSITAINNTLPVSTTSEPGTAFTVSHSSFSSSAPLYNRNELGEWRPRGTNDILQNAPMLGSSGMTRSRSASRVTKSINHPVLIGKRLQGMKHFTRHAKRTHFNEPESDEMPCNDCRRHANTPSLNKKQVIEHSPIPDLSMTRTEREKPQMIEDHSAFFLNAAWEGLLNEPRSLPMATYTGAHNSNVFHEVLEFDRRFESSAVSQELVATIPFASSDWGCGETMGASVLPAMVPVSQPPWNTDHITSHLEQLKVEEVRNVHPADFLALFGTDGLRAINDLLISTMPANGPADMPSICYNSHKQTVKLKGPAGVIEQARTRLETVLKDIYRRAGLQIMLGPHSKWSSALAKHYGSASKISANRKSDWKPSKQIFDLRANEEDSKLVALWSKHISPALHGILSPRLGQNYTASLVRRGYSEAKAPVYIRIQSECRQSESIRAVIREDIAAICDRVGQCHVVSRFFVGKLVLLGKSSSSSTSDDEGCENDDSDLCDFPWYKRWWEKPGMGASIGLRCSDSVSATLGGYVFINNQPYLLTVDHFIDKAQKNQGCTTAPLLDPLALTSPSLLDVKEMTACLEQSIRNVKADIAKFFNGLGSQDLQMDYVQQLYGAGDDLQKWENILNTFYTLRQELRKDEQEFVLGGIAHRCVVKARKPSACDNTPLSQSDKDPVVHRMDWALCTVNSARWGGVNRHRYQSDKDPMDYLFPNTEPHGLGELCRDTCDPESYTHVYFVGQKSGINHGRIGSSLTNCCMNGIPSQEWSIIVENPVSDENIFAGDSGAWILREYDHRVVGQLWGYKDGLLLFTPINVVFADIMDSLRTQNVGIHNPHLNPDTATIFNDSATNSSITLISEYKKPKHHCKPKGYRFPLGTTKVPQKPLFIGSPHLASPDTSSAMTSLGAALPNKCAAADIVPGSPVPSLASSVASSTGPGPKTPDDCHDTKTEHRLLSSLDLLAELAEHHGKIRSENGEETGAAANDERDSSICTIRTPNNNPIDHVTDKIEGHPPGYILHHVEPELNFDRIHLADIYQFTGFRKSRTFPMYNKPVKPRSQTSVIVTA